VDGRIVIHAEMYDRYNPREGLPLASLNSVSFAPALPAEAEPVHHGTNHFGGPLAPPPPFPMGIPPQINIPPPPMPGYMPAPTQGKSGIKPRNLYHVLISNPHVRTKGTLRGALPDMHTIRQRIFLEDKTLGYVSFFFYYAGTNVLSSL
jgi:hypothetical protein